MWTSIIFLKIKFLFVHTFLKLKQKKTIAVFICIWSFSIAEIFSEVCDIISYD